MKFIPSLLVSSEKEFTDQLNGIKGVVDMVQIDIADGKFTPNKTWAYKYPKKAKQLIAQDFELHLMVKKPYKTAKKWLDHPQLKRILIHIESDKNISRVIEKISAANKEIGLVLNPETPLSALDPYASYIQTVMLMGVNPGFQGQSFIPETLNRLKEFKSKYPNIPAAVDGGVNENTLKKIAEAGADIVCPGSAVFNEKNTPAENLKKLENNLT